MTDDFEDEPPTRPDTPALVDAPHCSACGRTYGEHAQTSAPQNACACHGTRAGFKDVSDGEERG